MSSNNKVAKYRKRKTFNVGVIVFLIIFVYVFITVYIFFTKDHLSIYEVKEGSTADDYIFKGLIIRDEEVISTDAAGYINYYHRDGDRVSKNSTIFSLDESKYSYDLISSSKDGISISSNEAKYIKNEIKDFQKSYQGNNFSTVYNFKMDLENSLLQIVNDSMLTNLENILHDSGTSTNTLRVVNSESSGVISYIMDNYEDLSLDAVTAENFDTEEYSKTQLRTMDLIEKNSPIYKIVTSDNWNIILLLDENQYKKLLEKETVTITLSEDGIPVTVPITVYQKGSDYFACLDMDKYMVRYINQRFISVEIAVNSAKGLKIPNSSIVEKEFYQVPLEYFTLGGDSNNNGLTKEEINTKDENNQVNYVFIPTDIYYSDESYGYVDSNLFSVGDRIYSEDIAESYVIRLSQSLKGAFNINKGYAIFRRIEILYENEEYCIIKKGTAYGLSVYDHIALNGNTATEQAVIY